MTTRDHQPVCPDDVANFDWPHGARCLKCGDLATRHRVKHHFDPADANTRAHANAFCKFETPHGPCGLLRTQHSPRSQGRKRTRAQKQFFVGIDGEGRSVRGPCTRTRCEHAKKARRKIAIGKCPEHPRGLCDAHEYVMLCASDETGERKSSVMVASGEKRLTTAQCLDFLLSMPDAAKCFAFSFSYDIAKILEDLPNQTIYELMRSELRARPITDKTRTPYPRYWKPKDDPGEPYVLNFQAGKFTVDRSYPCVCGVPVGKCTKPKHKWGRKRHRVVWDIFKFYGCKFVEALKRFQIGDAAAIENIEAMKEKRSGFEKLPLEKIRAYCFDECQHMASLARSLDMTFRAVGYRLPAFYSPGSGAGEVLKRMGIRDKIIAPPKEMTDAVASAFFGGRFENGVIGSIDDAVLYSFDLASAYPAQLVRLPCLLHSRWRWTKQRKRVEKARAACVRYKLPATATPIAWGPFPFREPDGTIAFPQSSGGGWVWRDEFFAGERLCPNVRFDGAWVLEGKCKCQPFKRVAKLYRDRLAFGKDAKGLVLKLALNSIYGKLAQSVGVPPFQSWVWAGITTSGVRAQILDFIGLHENPENVLTVATDGVYTREAIDAPPPATSGTENAREPCEPGRCRHARKAGGSVAIGQCKEHPKGQITARPLGAWEKKIIDRGLFIAMPGVYFPKNPTREDLDKIRARGIGRLRVAECWKDMVRAWEEGREHVQLDAKLERFCGAKSSIHKVHGQYVRSPDYGLWVPAPRELHFAALPKRRSIERVPGAGYARLTLRSFPESQTSTPYARAVTSPTRRALRAAEVEEHEQPDGGDLLDVDWGDE